MTDRTRAGIRRAAVTVLLFLLAASLLIYLMLPVFERKKAKEIFGRDDVIVGDSFHQPWFYVTEEGELHLTDWLCTRRKLLLPEYFNGVVVRSFPVDVAHITRNLEEIRFPGGVLLGSAGLIEWQGLRRVIFEEGQEDLSALCPRDCESLAEVYLPKSLRTVSINLLWNSRNPPDLTFYYAGTEEEWLALGSIAASAARTYRMVYDTPIPER